MTTPPKHERLFASHIVQRTMVLAFATISFLPGFSRANIDFPPWVELQSGIESDADIKESAGMPTSVDSGNVSPMMPEPPHVTAVSIAPASSFVVAPRGSRVDGGRRPP
jgi:hypothetical protein